MKPHRKATMILAIILTGIFSNPVFGNPVEKERTGTTRKSDRVKKLGRLRKFKKSIHKDSDLSTFNYHQKMYVIDAGLETVWNTYTQIKPNDAWKGPLNTYKQSYSSKKDSLYMAGDSILPAIEFGMVYELNLRIAKLINVGVAFQITEIDSLNKTIEFTYGKDNKSHGRQRIVFKEDGGKTFIVHYSNFKSESKFRDKYLYPKFHEKCMDEFHGNLKEAVMNKQVEQATEALLSLK